MKNSISLLTLVFALLMTNLVLAGGPKFQKAMGEALGGYATCKTTADYEALSQKFERISSAESEEWLPMYYQAHCLIIGNFSSAGTAEDRDAQLDKAQGVLDRMMLLEHDAVEAKILQAMLHTSRLVIDPMSRGQKYSMLSAQANGEALAMEPNNPRAQYLKLSNDMGTAQFFGKDVAEYCAAAQELHDMWDELDKGNSRIAPSWGKDQTLGLAKSCKE